MNYFRYRFQFTMENNDEVGQSFLLDKEDEESMEESSASSEEDETQEECVDHPSEEEQLFSKSLTSTQESRSDPVMVNTVEELKKVLVRDDKFKFVVNVEVQKTEEFQKFMAEKIQKNSEIADSKDGDRENRKAHGLKEAKKARVGQARFTRSSAKLMSFEKEENPEELKSICCEYAI